MKRVVKHALAITALSIAILVLAAYIAGEIYMSLDFREALATRHGRLVSTEETLTGESEGYMRFDISLESSNGTRTGGELMIPAAGGRLHPALLILGGLRTGSGTLDYMGSARDIVILALDYPYGGKKEKMGAWEFVRAVPRIRRAVLDTPAAMMTAVDYLLERDDVDPARITVIGGSLGAFFVPAHAAIDDRTAAAVMIYGAGDIESILAESEDVPLLLRRPAAWLAAVLLAPVEPLKYAADISPRPLLMVSAIGDERIPPRCSRLLHDAARQPKSVEWLDTGHLSVHDEAEFRNLVGEVVISWLVERELAPRGCFNPGGENW